MLQYFRRVLSNCYITNQESFHKMLKKSGGVDEEPPSKDKKKNKKEKGYNKIGDKSPDANGGDASRNRPAKPSSLKKPTFRLPSAGKKEKQKSVKINEAPMVDRPRSSTVPSLGGEPYPELDMSIPNISPLPADLVVLLEGRPVFGQPLASAPRCHDTALPVIVRECIDYLEQRLASANVASQLESLQGLYQRAADKVAVDRLRDSYERGELVSLDSCNPADVAGLLQAYLRSLPTPLLTNNLIQQFEHAADSKLERCIAELRQLLGDLPPLNCTVLAWLSVHLRHLCTVTSVKPASLALSLQTTLQMSHRLLVIFIDHVDELFPGVTIRPYVPQWVLCLPDAIAAVEEDLRWREMQLESLLARLAANSSMGYGGEPAPMDKAAVEQSWEQQRIVTQLKRKLKKLKKYTEAGRRSGGILYSTPEANAQSRKKPVDAAASEVARGANSQQQSTDNNVSSTNASVPATTSAAAAATTTTPKNSEKESATPATTSNNATSSTNNIQPSLTASTSFEGEQAPGDNARVLYAELKDLFGLLKMMKGRNPQNVGVQSADVSLAVSASSPVVKPAQPERPVTQSQPVAVSVAAHPPPTSTSPPKAPAEASVPSENIPPAKLEQSTAKKVIETAKSPTEKAESPPNVQTQQQSSPEAPTAELIEQRRSIQLAYLWLKIEEAEYESLISDTEKQLEQERQLIKQLAGVITEQRERDTESIANDDESENGGDFIVPSALTGSSMALVAHDELANDSDDAATSDDETHLNKTHKSVVLMRQNDKLERAIQDLEKNILTESEECLQLRVQLRFLELLNSSTTNDENSAIVSAAAVVSQMTPDKSATNWSSKANTNANNMNTAAEIGAA